MSGNEFSRRICHWRPNLHSSSKTGTSLNFFFGVDDKHFTPKHLVAKHVCGRRKWNVGDHLKCLFPKFEAFWLHNVFVASKSLMTSIFGCHKKFDAVNLAALPCTDPSRRRFCEDFCENFTKNVKPSFKDNGLWRCDQFRPKIVAIGAVLTTF